jgi:tetratricopeptide (TPR) repeat protein
MLVFGGIAQLDTGSLGEADRSTFRAVELARERGELELLHYALGCRVFLAGYTGKLPSSSAVSHECMEIAEKVGSTYLLCTGLHNLGVSYFWNREWKEAAASFESQLTIARQIGSGLQWEAVALARLAETYIGLGNNSQALATVDEAVTVARQRGTSGQECIAHLSRARVLLQAEGMAARSEIESALRQAQALVEETGARTQEPFIHEERAQLARLTGDDATHQRELREAHRLFTEMGATGHAERLAKELGL